MSHFMRLDKEVTDSNFGNRLKRLAPDPSGPDRRDPDFLFVVF